MKVAVIGCGVVGGAVAGGLERLGHKVFRHDPAKYGTIIEDVIEFKPEICFICVPTPQDESGKCDTSIVESVIQSLMDKHYKGILAIKSTVEPGFTSRIRDKYLRWLGAQFGMSNDFSPYALMHFTFVPEFLREAHAFHDFTEGHDVCVIGTSGEPGWVAEKIREVHGHYPKSFHIVSDVEAELVKYYSNGFNALRVVWANAFYELCKKLGASYDNVKNIVVSRPTVTNMYLDCNENFRGFAGPCVVPETKIYTPGGLRRIDELKVNDKVFTIDGTIQKIEEVLVRKVNNERMWKVKGQGVNEFIITSEHPVFAMKTGRFFRAISGKLKLMNSKDGKFDWVNAGDLEKGDLIVLPKLNISNTSSIKPEIARLFGYYAAEGSLENNSNRISLAFHSEEDEYISDVSSILEPLGISASIIKDGNKAAQRFSDIELRKNILRHVGRYSDKKELSLELMQSSDECVRNFLCGYFRGDGSLSGNRFTITTVSQKLHEQTKILLLRLGISFNIVERQKYTGQDGITHKKAYYIKVSNYADYNKICDIMKLPNDLVEPKHERKTSWFDVVDENNLMLIPIKSIEKIRYTGDVYNLEVAGNNTYVVEDAVVHNCLPKDTAALMSLAERVGVDAKIFKTIVEDNKLYKPTVPEGMRL